MGMRDHQFDAAQAAMAQAAQELGPERLCLAVAGGHAEHLATTVGVDANRDDDGNRDDAVIAANSDVGGIQPQIRPLAFDRPRQRRREDRAPNAAGEVVSGSGLRVATQPYRRTPR